jgi:hypothetical protein
MTSESTLPAAARHPTTAQRLFTTLYLLLGIGVGYASIVQDRVNYPTWALVGPQEFVAFHAAYTACTFLFLLPFAQLFVPVNVLMIWLRHPAISRSLVIFIAIISLLETFVTLRLAIPIHKQLAHVVDRSQVPGLLHELINVDVQYRFWPGLLSLVALALMVYQLTRSPELSSRPQV